VGLGIDKNGGEESLKDARTREVRRSGIGNKLKSGQLYVF
jgi:hypothetical protein